jgi:surface carbohydrate biosynthesis protein
MKTFDKAALLNEFDSIAAAAVQNDITPSPVFSIPAKPDRRVFPILYLPVEVKARELASKALIAREAKQQGFSVFMGASWVFNEWVPYLPPGVVLLKSTNALDVGNLANWITGGSMTAVLDEEIFGVHPTREYLLGTMHPNVAAYADLICGQGPSYARAFPYPVSPVVTGQPRVLTYKKSHGDDILVCLLSGNINNNGQSFGDAVRMILKLSPAGLASPQGKAWTHIARASIAHECDLVDLMRQTIQGLSEAFPERRIVVRAHPVEDPTAWQFNRSNIVMDDSPNIMAAMQRSAVVVYGSGCTTGVDAYLAGLPAVRLGRGGHGISAHMHVGADTAQEAIEAVRSSKPWAGDMSDHFAPVDITRHLVKLYSDRPANGTPQIKAKVKVEPQPFHRRKFPDTSTAEISALVGFPAEEMAWNTWRI